MIRHFFALSLIVLSATGAAQAQEHLKPVTAAAVNDLIVPGYETFRNTAAEFSASFDAFCADPGAPGLNTVNEGFTRLVESWSRIEMIRFGPARRNNRFERVFFWPDRRSRGLRQVQKILSEQDVTATDPDRLKSKSVAVQGLLALDFVLGGTGREDLLVSGHHRCAYGSAIAAAVAGVADGLLKDWQGEDGYAELMGSPSADNPVYRSEAEVLQEILRALNESLQIVKDLKIERPLGKSADAPKPKRAPFWRTDLTTANIRGNLAAISAFMELLDVHGDLDPVNSWLPGSLVFEISLILNRLALADETGDWVSALEDPETYRELKAGLPGLQNIHRHLDETLPAALGLILGFNSLDGD